MFTPLLDFQYFLPSVPPAASGETAIVGSIDVTVYPVWYTSMTLSWEVPESWSGLSPRFRVFRSRSDNGDFEAITPTAITAQYLVDTDALLEDSKFSQYHYYVEALLSNGQIIVSPITSTTPRMGDWQKIRKLEINRRELILLRKFTGIDTILLRRKRSGTRCHWCWDSVSGSVVKSNCPYCYGVSFQNGYRSGLRLLVQYDANVENKSYAYMGEFEQNQIGAWAIAFPDIECNDLLVRLSDHTVFRVEHIQPTQLMGENVRQILRITQLAKSDVEYKLIERELA